MENNFVLLQNTDSSSEQAHKPLQLSLELSTPNRNDIDVARCPIVYEDGHYNLQLQIQLSELEDAIQTLNANNQPQNDSFKSLTNLKSSEQSQLELNNMSNVLSNKPTNDIWSDLYDRETESLLLMNYKSSLETQNESKQAPKVKVIRSKLNRPKWLEQREQAANRSRQRWQSRRDLNTFNDSSSTIDDEDDPFKLLEKNDNDQNSLRLFDDQFKRLTSIEIELNQQHIGNCELTSLGSGKYSALAVFEQRGGLPSSQPFLLQYDVLILSFVIRFEDGIVKTLYAPPLLCASMNAKETENINQILFELTDMQNNMLLDIMFKQGQVTSRQRTKDDWMNFEENRSYQSLSEYIFLVEQIIKCYTHNFGYFKTQANHSLTKYHKVVPFSQVKSVSNQNFSWLTQHLEELTPVDQNAAIINYQDKYYQPLHMQSDGMRRSYSTYENNVVTSFLHLVLHNAHKIAEEYQTFITQQREQLNKGSHLSHGSYQTPIITMKLIQLEHCEQELKKLYSYLNQLANLYSNYQQIFKLPQSFLKTFPRNSKIFQEIKPYAEVFMNIWFFFKFGSFHLDKDRMLFEVTTLDRLFEYYCLYRLLEMLVHQGFTPIPNGNRVFEYGVQHNNNLQHVDNYAVANTYILRRGSQQAVLYYQPVIYSRCFENGILAYRTTQSQYPKARSFGDFYTPDFILKFRNSDEDRGQDDYVIFDAKFAQTNTILQYYINELTRKYAFETAIATIKPHQKSLKEEQMASGQIFDEADHVQKTILTLNGPVTVDREGNIIDTTNNPNSGDLQCKSNHKEYDFTGSKPPRMIFALQGRLNFKANSDQQSFASAAGDKNYTPGGSRHGASYTGVQTRAVRSMWQMHNSDLAKQCPPPTSIGIVEFNTKIDSTPALWNEIVKNIPYLGNDPRTQKEIEENEALQQSVQSLSDFDDELDEIPEGETNGEDEDNEVAI